MRIAEFEEQIMIARFCWFYWRLYFPKKYFTYGPAYIWPGNSRFKKISILSIICFVEYQKNISIPNCYSVFSAVSKKRFISENDGVFVARHIVTDLAIHSSKTPR